MNKLTMQKRVVSFTLKYPLYFILVGGIQSYLGVSAWLAVIISVGFVMLYTLGLYVNDELR